MRPSKSYKPGPSLEGNEAATPQRVFRKGRFMDVPVEPADEESAEAFVVDLTQTEPAATEPTDVTVAAAAPSSKYEARSLSATVKRDPEPVAAPPEEAPPILIEIDVAEPVAPPAKEWRSESSLDGDRYWRKDSRR